ncbi:MAG: outer membrane beta-barrel protein [Deltaproteobacteria bacterium]
MKKVAIMILALALVSGTALAQSTAPAGSGISVDLSVNYASEPKGGFDGTFGLGVGGNLDLTKSFSAPQNIEIQGRASLSYFNWDDDVAGQELEYRRIPLFIGGRVLTPVAPQLKLYGQLGLELSFDDRDNVGAGSDSDTHLGLTPGVGLIVPLSNQFYLGADLAWHIIKDDYVTLGVTVGFNLP